VSTARRNVAHAAQPTSARLSALSAASQSLHGDGLHDFLGQVEQHIALVVVEEFKRARDRGGTCSEHIFSDLPTVGGEEEGQGARITPAASLDKSRSNQPVNQPHGSRWGQTEHAPQPIH
jgi:hypothetical protein